jgi:hypothetical protein
MTVVNRFRLAPMSPIIRAFTIFLLALPVAFLVAILLGTHLLAIPTLLVIAIHSWVWLRLRPREFVVGQEVLEIYWPLTCIFHEGGTVCHVIAKRINLIRRLLGIVSQGQFVPIHFQEKSAVTDWTIVLEQ